jgi:Zn-dependent protease with chaperone function
MRALTLILVCLLLIPVVAAGQTATPTPQQPTSTASQHSSTPVAVPEPSEKALSYHRSGIAIWIFSTIWGLLIPALFLFTGFSARIRDWAQKLGKKWFFVIGIYFAIFTIINFVIDFPLSYYVGYVREHAYGLSNQTFGKWFGDSLKSLLLAIIFGALFIWIPYLLLKKSPQRWWLYTGIFTIPIIFLVVLIQPIWIDPLFNDFGPMKDKSLEAKILMLAERAGIEGGRVFEVDKSADTKALNAYVTGFGNTKRIVLWDTVINKLDENELLFVMGHEMGHYVLGHVWKSILFFAFLVIITLYAIHRTAGWMINKYRDRFGFSELSDIASLPLIILMFGLYFFLITPIALTFTRYNERESDRFGLEMTQDNRAAATAFVKLQTENLGVPRPHWLVRLWQASHPTLGERIDFCNEYRPWERGEPLQYGDRFKTVKLNNNETRN